TYAVGIRACHRAPNSRIIILELGSQPSACRSTHTADRQGAGAAIRHFLSSPRGEVVAPPPCRASVGSSRQARDRSCVRTFLLFAGPCRSEQLGSYLRPSWGLSHTAT